MTARSARTLMVFGTASDSGKSTIVAALCRAFAQRGLRVAPFKAQNMARNAYVCADGGEIGVAQAVQAHAARVEPSTDHNPILLKPEPGLCSQLIVRGRSLGTHSFRELFALRPQLLEAIEGSLARLRAEHDLIVLEGAGSPAEVNLQERDLPNLAAARAANAEIVLVADIDRGGVFASVLGTLELLPADLRARVRGIIINKFRGDLSLLEPGLEFLRARSGVPVLGVVPYLEAHALPDEDSLALSRYRRRPRASLAELEIAVVDTPCLANFEDVLPLAREPGVQLRLTAAARELLEADLVILAGSKSTAHDLAFVRAQGLAPALAARARLGSPLLGICGGAQMLGQRIEDPERIESSETCTAGLGLLPHASRFASPKRTQRVRGRLLWAASSQLEPATLDGFELHHGRMIEPGEQAAVLLEDGRREGCCDGQVVATMIHRLFDHGSARAAVLSHLRALRGVPPPSATSEAADPYDALADHVRAALDWPALEQICLGRH